MRRIIQTRMALVIVATAILGMAGGCVEPLFLPADLTFGLGWLVGRSSITTTTETTCFRNGIEIDCTEVASSH
jgi:hypothetical protein